MDARLQVTRGDLVVDGQQLAGRQLHGSGVAQVPACRPGKLNVRGVVAEHDLLLAVPARAAVVAQAGAVSHRRHAPPVGGEQRPAPQRQQVRRIPQDGRRVRLGPGAAAVIALGLAQVAVFRKLLRLVAPQADQAAVGQLGGVRLGDGVVGGRQRHGADPPPGAPLVHRLDGQQPVRGLAGSVDAQEQQPAVAELDGAVRGGGDGVHRLLPRAAAVGGASRPVAEPALPLRVGNGVEVALPAVDLLGGVGLAEAVQPGPGRHGERAHDDHARAQHQDAGVADVERRVGDGHRLRPGHAVVGAADELRLAVRAGVLLPIAREDDQQLAVFPAGDGGPGEVAPRPAADHPAPVDVRVHAVLPSSAMMPCSAAMRSRCSRWRRRCGPAVRSIASP